MHGDWTPVFLHRRSEVHIYCLGVFLFLFFFCPDQNDSIDARLLRPHWFLAHVAPGFFNFNPLLIQFNTFFFPFFFLFLTSFHYLRFFWFSAQSLSLQLILLSREKEHGRSDGEEHLPLSSLSLSSHSLFHRVSFHSRLFFSSPVGFIFPRQVRSKSRYCHCEKTTDESDEGVNVNAVLKHYSFIYSISIMIYNSYRSTHSESDSLPPFTVPDFKCMATPPFVSR